MLSLSASWKIARDLGPVWILERAKFAAQARFGILERRLPVSAWDFGSRDWLVPNAPDPDEFKHSLLERRRFFSFHNPTSLTDPQDVCSQADRIIRGEWPFFSRHWKQVGFPPDWHFNSLDGTRVDHHAHWSRIDLNAIEDVKFVWEPNRFSVVYVLARAYGAVHDKRYAEGFWALVEHWAAKNPPNSGVNWASGQEAALRVMAWCFGLYAFLSSPASTPERIYRLARMIEKHGERIAGFIDYALSQRNNHGITEAAGLFTIGLLFPQFARAGEWFEAGRELIIRQLREQIYEDGSYIQHSFNYERLMLDVMLWTFRLAELNELPFPPESYAVIATAAEFMLRFCDPETGRMPNYGGNDGSLVLPLTSCEYTDFRPTIQAAFYLVHRDFCFGDGPWNEIAERLFGAQVRASSSDVVRTTSSAPSSNSGYRTLRSLSGYCMLRATHYTDRPAQADQLHLDVWWRGENIACDPGTYLYNGRGQWTNALACTAVHNTVTMDGRDQMTHAEPFLWVDWAQAEWTSYVLEGIGNAIEASHNGYCRQGVRHRRCVLSVGDMDTFLIVDDVLGKTSGTARLHWLFPDYSFAWQDNESVLALETPAGPFQCRFFSASPASSSLARAGELVERRSCNQDKVLAIRGWRSLYYGEKEPALSLAVESDSSLPVRFVSVLAPGTVSIQNLTNSNVILRSGKQGVHVRFRQPERDVHIFEIALAG